MKEALFFGVLVLLFTGFASAEMQEVNYTVSQDLEQSGLIVTQLRYEPYPVNPGEYFDLYIKAQQGGGFAPDAIFELVPEFPFSLDANENALRSYGKIYSEPIVLHYKVRVSPDAVEGTNEIGLKYNSGVSGSAWVIKNFDVEVADAQTDFDLVVQDSTGSEFSIAIANTGKNSANSLIVRIPSQEDFKVTGATGQMVGNLDSGDYSIVSFNIVQVGRGDGFLTVEMGYTDSIGERRTVRKDVEYNFGSVSGGVGNFTRGAGTYQTRTTEDGSGSTWLWIIVIFVVLVISYVIYRKKKTKSIGENEKSSPEWVTAHRNKKG